MGEIDQDDSGTMDRRGFLTWVAAATAMLTLPGCPTQEQTQAPQRRARPYAYAYTQPVLQQPQPQYVYIQQQPQYQYIEPQPQIQQAQPAPALISSGGKISANSRNSWGASAATPAKMKLMNGVTRITVHHEGSAKPNNDSSPAAVATTLRLIQSQHRQRMGAGDIGYHFIIDRTGAIWQGRDWNYQGAHSSGANPNNLGIMLLGNFEIQQPTSAQISSLTKLTASLCRKFGVPRSKIYGHNDLCNTKCPGKTLKPYVVAMRSSLQV